MTSDRLETFMSYSRAQKEPFWATALDRMDGGVANIVRNLHGLVARSALLAPHVWMGSGWRTGSSEHSSGRAIDIMFVPNVGKRPTAKQAAARDALVAWVLANGKALKVQWMLVSRDGKPRTQSYNFDRGTWKNLENRGSISANHVDHIHLYFKKGATWPSSLNGAVIGGTSSKPSPGLPASGVSKPSAWDGKTFPGAQVFRKGEKHPATKVVQERLVKHGFNPGAQDSYFGDKTASAVSAFQKAQGWSGADADGVPGPETWKRLLAEPVKKAPAKKAPTKKAEGGSTRPKVSLSKLIEAARSDTHRKQGGTTPGAYDSVRAVEDALLRLQYIPKQYAKDGSFGSVTVSAYSRWQRSLGYRGRDADGIPGRKSLQELGRRFGFDVVS